MQVGSAGDFTACFSYLGYAIFFKEEMIYKVYGSAPSNFQVMGSASLGVEAGSSLSLAIAGETLFFLTRAGIVAYSGGTTQSVASAFGLERYHNAVGGSDGLKYYVSMQNEAGDWSLFVYDTRLGIWEREDDTQALGFAWDSDLYFLDADGRSGSTAAENGAGGRDAGGPPCRAWWSLGSSWTTTRTKSR